MPLTLTTLGQALLHIYDYDFGAGLYLPEVHRYEIETPCVIAFAPTATQVEEQTFHQTCLNRGFTKWLNVAVVSDTCDDVIEQTESCLVAAFNDDCKEGGWLRSMMNYRRCTL